MRTLKRLEPGMDPTVTHPLFGDVPKEPPNSPKDFDLIVVNPSKAAVLNEFWHSRLPLYGGTMRKAWALEHQGRYWGVGIWSQPVARLLPQDTWLELRRMALADNVPKNTASWFLAQMVKQIKLLFPDVATLCSYQDTDVHQGTIYKASNWSSTYVGPSDWVRPNRIRRASQSNSPKVRWELVIKP